MHMTYHSCKGNITSAKDGRRVKITRDSLLNSQPIDRLIAMGNDRWRRASDWLEPCTHPASSRRPSHVGKQRVNVDALITSSINFPSQRRVNYLLLLLLLLLPTDFTQETPIPRITLLPLSLPLKNTLRLASRRQSQQHTPLPTMVR